MLYRPKANKIYGPTLQNKHIAREARNAHEELK
jgi:hypothetical protein